MLTCSLLKGMLSLNIVHSASFVAGESCTQELTAKNSLFSVSFLTKQGIHDYKLDST